jgi:hypothetical protein
MTVDNSKLLDEMLAEMDSKIAGLEDKEAADIWGPIAKEAAKEDANRPSFWNQADGEIIGQVTETKKKLNYDKDGFNPVLVLDVDGKKVTAEAQHKTLAKELAKLLPVKGDFVRITPQGKAKGKNYYLYDVAVGKTLEDVQPKDEDNPGF